jgi:hypothetical protein
VNESKGYSGAQLSDASLSAIRKNAANSIRAELSKASPDLAAVNAKFRFWNSLIDVMDATVQRKTGQEGAYPKVASAVIAAGGIAAHGMSGGLYGVALYALANAVRSTGWRTTSAATKLSIADALANGNFDTVLRAAGGITRATQPTVRGGLQAGALQDDDQESRNAIATRVTAENLDR